MTGGAAIKLTAYQLEIGVIKKNTYMAKKQTSGGVEKAEMKISSPFYSSSGFLFETGYASAYLCNAYNSAGDEENSGLSASAAISASKATGCCAKGGNRYINKKQKKKRLVERQKKTLWRERAYRYLRGASALRFTLSSVLLPSPASRNSHNLSLSRALSPVKRHTLLRRGRNGRISGGWKLGRQTAALLRRETTVSSRYRRYMTTSA